MIYSIVSDVLCYSAGHNIRYILLFLVFCVIAQDIIYDIFYCFWCFVL